jgi:uncharacterized protein YjiS (DUF1127 family)
MREYIMHQAESLRGTFAFATLRRVALNWWKRRTLRKLRDFDDHMLADIGLTRDELEDVLRMPLSLDPDWEFLRRRRAQQIRCG